MLEEGRRVLSAGGRLRVGAMAALPQTNGAIALYRWAHRRWPNVVHRALIDLVEMRRGARCQAARIATTAVCGLRVAIAVGAKAGAR
jgi:hypothetical protein